MEIVSVLDRRIKKLVKNPAVTTVKGLSRADARKIIEMIAVIRVMTHPLQLLAVPSWRAHELSPGRPTYWSLWVTPNFRLVFKVDIEEQEVHFLNYEDYH